MFSQTKTTGASSTAAEVAGLVQDPLVRGAVAEEADDDRVLALQAQAVGRADGEGGRARDDRVGAEHALLDRGDVHAAAAAAAVAVLAADDLGHHPAQVEALGDAVAVAAVGARDVVVGPSAAQTPTAIASMPMYGCTEPRISFSSKSSMARISNARIRHIRSSSSSSVAASATARSPSAVLGEDRDRRADADLVALDRDDPLEHTRHGRLELGRHLLGLDLDDDLAGGDPITLRLSQRTIVPYSISGDGEG